MCNQSKNHISINKKKLFLPLQDKFFMPKYYIQSVIQNNYVKLNHKPHNTSDPEYKHSYIP
uniref:Pco136400 n=1 Tax=Arundo donax TaxID=35708 RepID=A0A0A9DAN5_ARUDO